MGVPAKAGTLLPRFKIAPFADGFHHRGSTGLPQGEKPKQGQGDEDLRGPTVWTVNMSASAALPYSKGGTFRRSPSFFVQSLSGCKRFFPSLPRAVQVFH